MHTWYRPTAAAVTSGSGMLTSFRKAEWAPAACTCNTYATICAFRRNAFCPMPLPPPPRPFEGPLQYFFIYSFFIPPLFFFSFRPPPELCYTVSCRPRSLRDTCARFSKETSCFCRPMMRPYRRPETSD